MQINGSTSAIDWSKLINSSRTSVVVHVSKVATGVLPNGNTYIRDMLEVVSLATVEVVVTILMQV